VQVSSREKWGSYSGFIFAAVGSAVGIGNIWRFPYVTGENGGGAFLAIYLVVVFTFGLSFMVLELLLGRYYQTSVISALKGIRKRFALVGAAMVAVTFAILSYYMAILGWILSYFVMYATGTVMSFEEYSQSWYPLLSFAAIAVVNYLVVRSGVNKGIEKVSKYGILLFVAIMIPLTAIGLTLPGADRGVAFYLTPDATAFSDPQVWSAAFGQAFFSLSIGMGVLLTYGSYLAQKRPVLSSSLLIIGADMAVAFVAGLMVFSFVFSHGANPAEGTTLVFRVMPQVFSVIELGAVIAPLFFVLLLLAGITSSVSMFQLPVSALEDSLGYSRRKAAGIIWIAAFAAGLPSALSYSALDLQIAGTAVLDVVNDAAGDYGLPIAGVAFAIVGTWFLDKKILAEQVNLYSKIRIPTWLVTFARVALPVLVVATILTQIAG
jgi:NSS family neurotransmitter:Na+ symporter